MSWVSSLDESCKIWHDPCYFKECKEFAPQQTKPIIIDVDFTKCLKWAQGKTGKKEEVEKLFDWFQIKTDGPVGDTIEYDEKPQIDYEYMPPGL